MFAASFFAKTYFAGTYFPPVVSSGGGSSFPSNLKRWFPGLRRRTR